LSDPTQYWEIIKDSVQSFGLLRGIFLLFFWVAHFWIYRLYQGRLRDRQKQIDDLAKDNREYRERFLTLLDRHFGLVNGKTPDVSEVKPEGDKAQIPPSPKQDQIPGPQTPGPTGESE
jgi:hypothetical protein